MIGCNTRYYANYYVDSKESARVYYHGPFEFIHSGMHLFIEKRTLDLFTTMMLTSWSVHFHHCGHY